ncbi:hypothetical protein [Pseudomonas sp. TAF7]|uniref:hypothetical protein n=1 Tax=Pseudomonas sp. TAF7 TaxID=3233073 RepID=UPI003F9B5041
MDFLEAINQGIEKATAAEQANIEVNEAFQRVNTSLESYPAASISIERGTQTNIFDTINRLQGSVTTSNSNSEYHPHNALYLVAQHRERGSSSRKKIANWKQHVNGFPCTISYEGQKQTCYSGEDLAASFGELFSSVSFGKALLELLSTPAVSGEPGEV